MNHEIRWNQPIHLYRAGPYPSGLRYWRRGGTIVFETPIRTCQEVRAVLITGNRVSGDDSLA